MRRIVFLAVSIILLTSLGAATEWDFPNIEVDYTDGAFSLDGDNNALTCTSDSGECPDSIAFSFEDCSQDFVASGSGFGTLSYTGQFSVEEECGTVDSPFQVSEGAGGPIIAEGGRFQVTAYNMGDDWGRNMLVNIDTGNDQLRNFFLTHNNWGTDILNPADYGDYTNFVRLFVQDYTSGSSEQSEYFIKPDQSVGTEPIFGLGDSLNDFIRSDDVTVIAEGHTDEELPVMDETQGYKDSFEYGDVESVWGFDSILPVHNQGNYYSNEIIIGWWPIHADRNGEVADRSGSGPYVYECNENSEMDNGFIGETVPQVVDVNEQDPVLSSVEDRNEPELYRCAYNSVDGYHWTSVTECNSGLDHDGDGKIDGEHSHYQSSLDGEQDFDPNCESSFEEKSDSDLDGQCPQGIVRTEVALGPDSSTETFIPQFEDDGECTTDSSYTDRSELIFSHWVDDAEKFVCHEDDTNNEDLSSDRQSFCETANFGPYSFDEGGEGAVPAVEYYPSENYVEAMMDLEGEEMTGDYGNVLDVSGPKTSQSVSEEAWTVETEIDEISTDTEGNIAIEMRDSYFDIPDESDTNYEEAEVAVYLDMPRLEDMIWSYPVSTANDPTTQDWNPHDSDSEPYDTVEVNYYDIEDYDDVSLRTELYLYETRDSDSIDRGSTETTHEIDIQHDKFVDDTTFVDSDGWTTQMKTLLETEIEHHEDSHSTCSDCHELEIWQDTHNIKSPEVEDAYDNDHPSTNIDAWNVENAGVDNNEIFSPTAPDSEEEVFTGGFAGVCEEEQRWQYTSDGHWECSGAVPWDMSMYLPETSGEEVGFVVPPYVAMDDVGEYPEVVQELGWDGYNFAAQSLDDSPELEEYWAVCWAGSLTDHAGFDSFDEMYGNEEEDIERQGEEGVDFVSEYGLEVSSEQPFGFAGEISEMENYDTYACRVEFTNSEGLNVMGGDRGEAITPREIHRDGEILEGFTEEYEGWEESYEEGELQDFVN